MRQIYRGGVGFSSPLYTSKIQHAGHQASLDLRRPARASHRQTLPRERQIGPPAHASDASSVHVFRSEPPRRQGGKVRYLATSGAQRNRFAPTVPTRSEQGYEDLVFDEWFGFYLPAKTPAEIVNRANSAIRTALAAPDVVEGLATTGWRPSPPARENGQPAEERTGTLGADRQENRLHGGKLKHSSGIFLHMFLPQGSRRSFLLNTSSLSACAALATLSAVASRAQAAGGGAKVRMPVIFIGHGSPMNAVRESAFTRRLSTWGRELPRPTAILSVSAHWLSRGATGVGIQERPKTIHDFGGFPQELFDVEYPAPGHPELAREVASLVKRASVIPTEQWGLDHGTWTVLKHLYPKADVPVFQLSIDYDKPAAFHYALGQELAALRGKGVLILGSGNVAHNLRATDRGVPDGIKASRPWAQAFDEAVKSALTERDHAALQDYGKLEGAATAVATPDHYFPFLYALGAGGTQQAARTLHEGFQSGTISMRCVQFG
jgi:4,5-DOPA dioxygenase extradiol